VPSQGKLLGTLTEEDGAEACIKIHKPSEITTETAGKKDIPRPPATASSHPSQPLLELSLLGHQPVPDTPEKQGNKNHYGKTS
jgi:hypothetical protein